MGSVWGPSLLSCVCNRYLIELPRWRFEIEPPLSVGSERDRDVLAENCLSAVQRGPWKKKWIWSSCARRHHIREIFRAAWLLDTWLSVNLNGQYQKGFFSLGQITHFIQKPCPWAHAKNNHLHLRRRKRWQLKALSVVCHYISYACLWPTFFLKNNLH